MSTENRQPVIAHDPSVIISAARQLLSQLPPSNPSPATRKGYKRELHRLITKNQVRKPEELWAAICDTHSKRTYYRRVAATRDRLRVMVEEALPQERIEVLRFALGVFAKLHEQTGSCPVADPKPRHSKRQDLRGLPVGLPVDWRDALFSILQARESQFQRAYLVAAVSGCRPAELEQGARISVTATSLTIRLTGAKVTNTQGQRWREITYSVNPDAHQLVQALHKEIFRNAMIQEGFGEFEVKVDNKAGFTSAIRRAGRHVWPKRRADITPYCLRHAAASDWKSCLSAEEVSGALGHLAPDTKRLYGQRQMSKAGGLRPAAVRADRPIKVSAKSAPNAKAKTTSRR